MGRNKDIANIEPKHEHDENGSSHGSTETSGRWTVAYKHLSCTCGRGMGRTETGRVENTPDNIDKVNKLRER